MNHASSRSTEIVATTRRARGLLLLALGAWGCGIACSSAPTDVSTDDAALGARNGCASDGGVSAADAGARSPSACGTTVPPSPEIVDSALDVWTLTAGGRIARNGVVDPTTDGVASLLYFNGVVYQDAHGSWRAWQNGAWRAASDPRTGASCTNGPPRSPGGLSYMIGYGGGGESNAHITAFEAMLGRPMDLGTDSVTLEGFEFGPYASSNGRALGKILILPMLSQSWDSNQSLQDLSQAASGAYDAVYTRVAQAMAAFGNPPVSVRIGHEMNGNWYPWSATTNNAHHATPANYIATFKRIARIVRTYNPHTLIEWCTSLQPRVPMWSGSPYTPLDYWVGAYDPVTNPGGADVVSMDFYEGDSGSRFAADIRGGQFGLDWLESFATEKGVKIALSEVASGSSSSRGQGTGCPCSDDGVFMQDLVDWLGALPPGQLTHFVFSPWAPADDLLASGNSRIQKVWTKTWSNTHFEGSWWKGPKVPSQ